jgi:F420-0:gamma-glutamyl ligase-like protein
VRSDQFISDEELFEDFDGEILDLRFWEKLIWGCVDGQVLRMLNAIISSFC